MRLFLYARKSTDEDDRQLLSIESQLAELREFSQKESLNIIQEFIESKTAKMPGRPIFNEMVKEIEKGQAEDVVLRSGDRIVAGKSAIKQAYSLFLKALPVAGAAALVP